MGNVNHSIIAEQIEMFDGMKKMDALSMTITGITRKERRCIQYKSRTNVNGKINKL